MKRKEAETETPIIPPTAPTSGIFSMAEVATMMAIVAPTTMLEWPSEKNRPTVTGSLPLATRLRVTEGDRVGVRAGEVWRDCA